MRSALRYPESMRACYLHTPTPSTRESTERSFSLAWGHNVYHRRTLDVTEAVAGSTSRVARSRSLTRHPTSMAVRSEQRERGTSLVPPYHLHVSATPA